MSDADKKCCPDCGVSLARLEKKLSVLAEALAAQAQCIAKLEVRLTEVVQMLDKLDTRVGFP